MCGVRCFVWVETAQLPAHEGNRTTEGGYGHRGAPVTNVTHIFSAITDCLETVVPKRPNRDLPCGRCCHQTKSGVSRNTHGDVTLSGFEFVRPAPRKLSVEKDVPNCVLCNHLRSGDIGEFNVSFRRNMGADRSTSNIGDVDLTTTCFQID